MVGIRGKNKCSQKKKSTESKADSDASESDEEDTVKENSLEEGNLTSSESEKTQTKNDSQLLKPKSQRLQKKKRTESSTDFESTEDDKKDTNEEYCLENQTAIGKEKIQSKNHSQLLKPKTAKLQKRKRTGSSTDCDSSEDDKEYTKEEHCLEAKENLTGSGKAKTQSKNGSKQNACRLRKRKRIESSTDSSEEDPLPESCLEIEEKLNISALKNNLSADDVKTILKKVVSNEHVLALVKLREEELLAVEGNAVPEPKLTRSKIKELRSTSSAVPWTIPLTPVKNIPVTSPEVTALIAQDMPEEESDEEYDPAHDEESDDGEPLEFHSDVDSQPKTPATPGNTSIQESETPVISTHWSEDGLFKIPKVISHEIPKLTPTKGTMTEEEELTIARRTRSKLSLSDTPIEQLQDSFVPPDIPADMYDFEEIHQMDNVWRDFLQEFMKPLPQSHEEADDDADPEYNHQADSNTLIEDEVLDNAEARVSRRELNDLVAELFDDIDFPLLLPLTSSMNPEQVNNDEQQVDNNNTSLDNSSGSLKILDLDAHNTAIKYESFIRSQDALQEPVKELQEIQVHNVESTEPIKKYPLVVKEELNEGLISAQIPIEVPADSQKEGEAASLPTYIIVEAAGFSEMHRGLLQQQLRMHVQLLTQHFLQVYGHPELWNHGPKLKHMMTHLNDKARGIPESVFSVCNLESAVKVFQEWEEKLSEDTTENQEYIRFVRDECEKIKRKHGHHLKHAQNFPESVIKIIANSPVFLYPHLLPPQPFRVHLQRTKSDQYKKWEFVQSEDHYISLGLEQFDNFIKNQRRKRNKPKQREVAVKDICEMVAPHMLPFVTAKSLIRRIGNVRNISRASNENPILYYFQHGKVKETKHKIFPYDMKKTPKDYPKDQLPGVWKKYCGDGKVLEYLTEALAKRSFKAITPKNNSVLAIKYGVPLAVLNENGQSINIFIEENADIAVSQTTVSAVLNPQVTTFVNAEITHPTVVSKSVNNPILASGRYQEVPFANGITLNNDLVKSEPTLIIQPVLSSRADIAPVQILQRFNFTNSILNIPYNNKDVSRPLQHIVPLKQITSNQSIIPYDKRLFENCLRAEDNENSQNQVIVNVDVENDGHNFKTLNEIKSNLNNSKCHCFCEEKVPKILKGQTFLTQYFNRKERGKSNTAIPNSRKQSLDGISYRTSNSDHELCIDEDANDNNCLLLNDNIEETDNLTTDYDNSDRNNLKKYFKLVNSDPLLYITIKLSYLIDLCKEVFEVQHTQGKEQEKLTSSELSKARSILSRKLLELDKMLPSMPFLSTADNSLQEREDSYENNETADKSSYFPSNVGDSITSSIPISNKSKTNGIGTPGEIPQRNNIILSVDNSLNNLNDNLFATAYFEKVLARLNATSQRDHGMSSYSNRFMDFQSILDTFDPSVETPDVLYRRLEAFFGHGDADLADEFLLFLTPTQAAAAGRFMDHFVLMNMSQFVDQLQVVFARKPATIRKILRNLQQALSSIEMSQNDPEKTRLEVDKLKAVVLPHLRASPTLTDLFLKFLPDERPPDSANPTGSWELFPESLWLGQSSSEGAEVVEAGTSEKGSLYCACVRSHGMNARRNRKYCCIACGMTYLQGQVFVQHGRVLRPARIVFCDSQLLPEQHAVRLSGASQSIAPTNQSDDENVSPKRSLKNIKTPSSKTKHQKTKTAKPDGVEGASQKKPSCSKTLIKNSDIAGDVNVDDSFRPLERQEMDAENIPETTPIAEVIDITTKNGDNEQLEKDNSTMDTYEETVITKVEIISSDSIFAKPNRAAINWTRDEDKTILQVLQCESDSEQTFVKINELMPHRSMQEIRERFHSVMDFLQEIASSQSRV